MARFSACATRAAKRAVLFEARRRLDIDSIAFILVVENLFFQSIGIGGQAIAQGACRRSGGRSNAPHQGKRAPEGQPPVALHRSRALDHAEAIIEHCVMEGTMVSIVSS